MILVRWFESGIGSANAVRSVGATAVDPNGVGARPSIGVAGKLSTAIHGRYGRLRRICIGPDSAMLRSDRHQVPSSRLRRRGYSFGWEHPWLQPDRVGISGPHVHDRFLPSSRWTAFFNGSGLAPGPAGGW